MQGVQAVAGHGAAGGHEHVGAGLHQDALVDGEELLATVGAVYFEEAGHEGGGEVGVARQEAEGAVLGLGDHLDRLFVDDHLFGREHLEVHGVAAFSGVGWAASSGSAGVALPLASAMVPIM